MTYITNGMSPAGRRIYEAGVKFQNGGCGQPCVDDELRAELPPKRTKLFLAPIELTHRPAAYRDAGKVTCRRVIDEVAEKYGVSPKMIISHMRPKWIMEPRHEAMFRCVAETDLPLTVIARVFRKDHTTIGHAVMRHHIRTGEPLPDGFSWKSAEARIKRMKRGVL